MSENAWEIPADQPSGPGTAALFTRDGGFVHSQGVPPFRTWPDVILWGARVFMLHSHEGGPDEDPEIQEAVYVEAWSYWMPPPAVMADFHRGRDDQKPTPPPAHR